MFCSSSAIFRRFRPLGPFPGPHKRTQDEKSRRMDPGRGPGKGFEQILVGSTRPHPAEESCLIPLSDVFCGFRTFSGVSGGFRRFSGRFKGPWRPPEAPGGPRRSPGGGAFLGSSSIFLSIFVDFSLKIFGGFRRSSGASGGLRDSLEAPRNSQRSVEIFDYSSIFRRRLGGPPGETPQDLSSNQDAR